jgi:hypothetical protein
MSAVLDRIRQLFCRHACYIEDIIRLQNDLVECQCNRCGKVLHADCGLALHAQLMQKPKHLRSAL